MWSKEEQEVYEKKYKQIEEENKAYLKRYEVSLQDLSEKTIRRHLANADLFLNDFLLEHQMMDMQEGIHEVYWFIDDFFIRKCLWSTPSSVKSTAASIKKFYKCMCENGLIGKGEYAELCVEIKDHVHGWMRDCSLYNDGDLDAFYGFDIDL